jgi:hypothetical protein
MVGEAKIPEEAPALLVLLDWIVRQELNTYGELASGLDTVFLRFGSLTATVVSSDAAAVFPFFTGEPARS